MKKALSLHIGAAFFLLAIFLAGCSDLADMDGGGEEGRNLENAPLLVRQALAQIDRRAEPVYLLDMHKHAGNDSADARRPRALSSDNFEIRWADYTMTKEGSMEVALIPLAHKSQTAFSLLTENGRSRKSINKVTSKLIVRRDTLSGEIIIVVGTYLCDRNYYTDHGDELERLGYEFEGTGFTGYFIASRLDGTMLSGKRILKGKEQFRFIPNPLPPAERDSSAADNSPIHLYLDMRPAAISLRSPLAISDSPTTSPSPPGDEEDEENLICSLCNLPVTSGCTCMMVIICKICGKTDSQCICHDEPCGECGELKIGGNCLCCRICHKLLCECADNRDDDGNGSTSGNSSEGGSTGGNTGGGGSGGNVSGGGGGSTGTGSSYVTTPGKLTSAAANAVNEMNSKYGSIMPVCNFGVQAMFKNIFGDKNLPPGMTGRANEMATAWANNPDYWQPISLSEAQEYANKGYFVVIGYINPIPNSSGHVVVVVPGKEHWSSSWKCHVPSTMDTGSRRRSSSGSMTRGFSPDKKDKIRIYYYKRP